MNWLADDSDTRFSQFWGWQVQGQGGSDSWWEPLSWLADGYCLLCPSWLRETCNTVALGGRAGLEKCFFYQLETSAWGAQRTGTPLTTLWSRDSPVVPVLSHRRSCGSQETRQFILSNSNKNYSVSKCGMNSLYSCPHLGVF